MIVLKYFNLPFSRNLPNRYNLVVYEIVRDLDMFSLLVPFILTILVIARLIYSAGIIYEKYNVTMGNREQDSGTC